MKTKSLNRGGLRAMDPFYFGVYAFWALLAALCWFSAVSCAKSEKTTVIRDSGTNPTPSGVDVKIQGKDSGVQVDVHGKTDK